MGKVRCREIEQGNTLVVEEIHKVTVHVFSVGDVEDPEIYAAQPIWDWQQTDAGKFVMEHAVETPSWVRMPDTLQYGYKFQVRAKLMGARLTEYLLRHS